VQFRFPEHANARLEWTRLINRNNEKGQTWHPNSTAQICRIHFPDGKPTERNLYPTLHLRCDPETKPVTPINKTLTDIQPPQLNKHLSVSADRMEGSSMADGTS